MMVDACPILHVDDDAEIRLIVEMALQLDPAFRVQGASGSGEAMAIVVAADARPPVGILLDYMMPDGTGIDLMQTIRAVPAFARTPFVFLTARVSAKDTDRMLEAGAIGVLAKPFNPITLAGDVRRLLGLKQPGV